MSTTNLVKNSHQARLSKLQSKKKQLEQLLRKKARLDFEITTLKKSISKEQKQTLKEITQVREKEKSLPNGTLRDVAIQESLDLAESEDPEEALSLLEQLDKELNSVFLLLLEYSEPLN